MTGVTGRVQLDDLAVAGRAQALVERVDGNAVADHFLGEHRVGNPFERHQGAGKRRGQGEPDGGRVAEGRVIHSVMLDLWDGGKRCRERAADTGVGGS